MKSFLYFLFWGEWGVLSSFDGTSPPPKKKTHLIGPKLSAHFALRSQASAPQTAPWTGNITQSLLERQSGPPQTCRIKISGAETKNL